MYAIILAGGSGSRLWPLSRELYPKQFLNFHSKKSLLQTTFDRLSSIIDSENIISITNVKHSSSVKMQLGENSVVLSEPISKNTAPTIAMGMKYITQKTNEDETIFVLPSDLFVEDTDAFLNTIKDAEKIAKQGKIVIFGCKPTYPETGFGYIHSKNGEVLSFTEKPNLEKAQEYLADGNYFWNSGMFMFTVSTIKKEFKFHCPEILQIIENIDCLDKNISFNEFNKMPTISIDYAVMEKSQNLAMIQLDCGWKDLGSWKAIYDISPKDEKGNVFVGHVVDRDSKNSLVYSSSKVVATIGLEDTVIIETDDAILACKKDRTQDVKHIYETLKQQHDDTHLVHKTVYRPWGFYTVIASGKGFQSKIIHVNEGQKLSVQSHNHRSEHWVVLTGMAKVVLEGKEHILSPGHSIDIGVKAIHSLQNPYEEDLEIIEIQKGDILSEDDIIRYEDMYGRV